MVGTFIQLDENVWPVRPFGGKERYIPRASTIEDTLAWSGLIHTKAMP